MPERFEVRFIGAEMGQFGQGVKMPFRIARGTDQEEKETDFEGIFADWNPPRHPNEEAGALFEHTTVLMAESHSLARKNQHLACGKGGGIPERFGGELREALLHYIVHLLDDRIQ